MRARDRAITQFFFETDLFLRYRDRCAGGRHQRQHRARHPADHALPANAALRRALRRHRCPIGCAAASTGLDDDPETRRMIAANVAIEQVQRLREHGVDEFHFYTLNRAELSLCDLPRPGAAAAHQRSAGGLMARHRQIRDTMPLPRCSSSAW